MKTKWNTHGNKMEAKNKYDLKSFTVYFVIYGSFFYLIYIVNYFILYVFFNIKSEIIFLFISIVLIIFWFIHSYFSDKEQLLGNETEKKIEKENLYKLIKQNNFRNSQNYIFNLSWNKKVLNYAYSVSGKEYNIFDYYYDNQKQEWLNIGGFGYILGYDKVKYKYIIIEFILLIMVLISSFYLLNIDNYVYKVLYYYLLVVFTIIDIIYLSRIFSNSIRTFLSKFYIRTNKGFNSLFYYFFGKFVLNYNEYIVFKIKPNSRKNMIYKKN